ncbi:MAG: pilus assembly protein CpaB [Chloroflexi bacterium]|nr:MAG: pilus assembly protein CpaB [Chloroflexota bacterium]
MSNKLKAVIIVFVGLVLVGVGVIASILLIQRLQSSRAEVQQTGVVVKTTVVVVTRDLMLGDQIKPEDVNMVEIPVEFSPRNAVTKAEDAIGKFVKTDLIQGEMVLAHNLANPTNSNHDLSFVLSDEHILMAFPADDLMSRESIIQRGDIVDIFATFQQVVQQIPNTTTDTTTTNGTPQEPVMRTFTVDAFQKVSVTALVLEIIPEENNNPPIVGSTGQIIPAKIKIRAYLLALNPQDALVLKHLKDTGAEFDIVLRSPTSTAQFELTPVTEDYIIEFYGLEILP